VALSEREREKKERERESEKRESFEGVVATSNAYQDSFFEMVSKAGQSDCKLKFHRSREFPAMNIT
jgi:hypothetical protein